MNIHLVVGTANPVYAYLFLQSLIKYTDYPYSLHWVVDNGVKIQYETPPKSSPCREITVTELGTGFHGVGHNWNIGIDLAEKGGADWIGVINDDVMFSQNWLSRLVSYIEKHQDLGAISPIWHWQGVPNIEGMSPQEAWKSVEPWLEGYSASALSYSQTNSLQENRGIQGCFFFLNMKALKDLAGFEKSIENHPGRFDETTFFANWEDTDICMRLNRAGYNMVVTHAIALHHHGSQTVARLDVRQQTGDFYRAGIPKFLKKWGLKDLAGKPFMVHNSLFIVDGKEYPPSNK